MMPMSSFTMVNTPLPPLPTPQRFGVGPAPGTNPNYPTYVQTQQPMPVTASFANPLQVQIGYEQFQQLQKNLDDGFASVVGGLQEVSSTLNYLWRFGIPMRNS